jgi:hypothetical protein
MDLAMSNELEKRLRELAIKRLPDIGTGALNALHDAIREAARIGAELEREECAKLAASFDVDFDAKPRFIENAIRARGASSDRPRGDRK